jgi:predicted O-methyltransferase YrrM
MISGFYFQDFQPSLKNEAEFYNKRFTFNYHDWFYVNFNVWRGILKPLKKITYLEIGSFEGRSAVFIGNLENAIEITAVDTFKGSMEFDRDMKEIDFNVVYNNCYQNLKKIDVETNLITSTSDNFFINNKKKFNVIYIDGSHFYEDVKNDFINSMNCLEKNGILICDDFLWFEYHEEKLNPFHAIIECYQKYINNLEILHINHQIIFKKII